MQLFKALLSQLLACAAVLGLRTLFPLPISVWQAAAMQACLAALCSRGFRQPVWWLPIHLLFIPTILLGLSWQVPAWLYLLMLLLLTLLFWGTVKGDVPLFLSSSAVSEALIEIVSREEAQSFVDIGAGFGTVVVPLGNAKPDMAIVALERAPLPWLLADWRCRNLTNIRVGRSSFWDQDLRQFDVVFAFLSPLVMAKIGEKVRREMRAGCLFISSSFPIPNGVPESVLELNDRRKTKLYCYRIGRI
ncbi:class I SAM-dependent methyltransferase [Methylomonas rosea]|uniref:Class I SAM-dependent methyltransferase n=1 Tax=Methylomonas rosea TaxID=2952227 RepID=A0ABT1TWK2_9GAMM|nr:class I SAM-dependent methyltransferase [Methylomonas sp. WSC-7]MCQ8118817.1 class I SAM-dependent methyltransferase [Methylomonas sp. WSC-7]